VAFANQEVIRVVGGSDLHSTCSHQGEHTPTGVTTPAAFTTGCCHMPTRTPSSYRHHLRLYSLAHGQ
jgi:hypothetical protein